MYISEKRAGGGGGGIPTADGIGVRKIRRDESHMPIVVHKKKMKLRRQRNMRSRAMFAGKVRGSHELEL